MTSLSPEAIEILKEMHGKTELRFDSEAEAKAFQWRVLQVTEKDAMSPGGFYLSYCIDSVLWFEDDEGKSYLGIPLSSYGRGATKALHAAGVI